MELDDKQCYDALKSRDARFDGMFFVGVRSTGIYCRPVCPARTPLRKNINFYRHPIEAESAGLRPCLRCRPETAPGTPAWAGTSTTVTRALRLISEGLQDDLSLEDLAETLGVSTRHLRRLFDEHLGASPIAVAQLYRVQMAKRLISDTTFSMTDIAFMSGFGSLRRFNTVFKKTYQRAPRSIRSEAANAKTHSSAESFTLHLCYRLPFDMAQHLQYLAGRAIPGVEVVEGERYSRVVQFGDTTGTISVTKCPDKERLILSVDADLAPFLAQIVERVRRIFDTYADPTAISASLSEDPTLRELTDRRPGLRLPGAWCAFELTVRAILGQQISVKGATTLSGKLVRKYGTPVSDSGRDGLTHAFPTPDKLSRGRLYTLGMPKKRGLALQGLAKAAVTGALTLDASQAPDKLYDQLVALPGIGPWTAQYVLMRGLSTPDAFPEDDLGLINALEALEGQRYKGRRLLERAEPWRPWRAYACLHLWQSLGDNTD
jgi:AraC family transcriptional regulator of adaptative response / DNA-3-methyladenine glycosylase II